MKLLLALFLFTNVSAQEMTIEQAKEKINEVKQNKVKTKKEMIDAMKAVKILSTSWTTTQDD